MTDLCNEIAQFGKSMGSTSRYRIVEALLKGEKTVSDLVKIVKLSQPAVSQHLKTLKSSNLVIDRKIGQEVFYTVNSKYMLDLLKKLSGQVSKKK